MSSKPDAPRIVVCTWEPLSPKAWSGTTPKIVDGLRSRELLAGTIDSSKYAPKLVRTLAHSFSAAWYLRAGSHYLGRPLRAFRSRRVHPQYAATGATAVLHIANTAHLPLSRPTPGIRHYLYIDNAWDLWADKAFWQRQAITPRLYNDVQELERKALAQMDHIFPIGEYLRDHLIKSYQVPPSRVTAAGTGRGGITPLMGEKDYSTPKILFVAKQRFEDKGGRLVIDAFRIAQKRMPSLNLVVVGPQEEAERVQATPNAQFFNFLPWEALEQLFHTATLFAMPADREPWGLVFLEALSTATPIVGMARNAVPEFTRQGQFGFELKEHSADELADIFVHAHQHPEKLKAMGEGGRDYVLKRYTWDNTVDTITHQILADHQQGSSASPEQPA